MAVSLSPIGGAGWQFFDNNGAPLTGGKLYTYAAGTTTPQATYTANTGATAHSNPIILDSAGRVPSGGEIWLATGVSYKFVLKTSVDTQIWSADNITGIAGAGLIENFTGTGSQTVFTFANAPFSENTTQVYINGVYQQKNTYTVVGTALTFSTAPPYTASIEVLYT
ncbi:MAG: DUF4183 domain-containing protein [Pseudomonadota bacterium]